MKDKSINVTAAINVVNREHSVEITTKFDPDFRTLSKQVTEFVKHIRRAAYAVLYHELSESFTEKAKSFGDVIYNQSPEEVTVYVTVTYNSLVIGTFCSEELSLSPAGICDKDIFLLETYNDIKGVLCVQALEYFEYLVTL